MGDQTKNSDILLARLAEGLDSTAKMTQALLSDLRESEADFSAVKAELNILKENVKGLSTVVREGDGSSSILTRVALIEQSIESIRKWIDSHVDVHQNIKKDISDVRTHLGELESRIAAVEKFLREIEEYKKEEERQKRISIDRENDLAYEKKKANEKVRADKQTVLVKLIAAVVLGVASLIGGYFVKSCEKQNPTELQQNKLPVIFPKKNSSD